MAEFKKAFIKFQGNRMQVRATDMSPAADGKRLIALREVIAEIDKTAPMYSDNDLSQLGTIQGTGVDVATLIFHATELYDEKSFVQILNEIKQRGVPETVFGDALLITDGVDWNSSRTANQLGHLMEFSKGNYDKDLAGVRKKAPASSFLAAAMFNGFPPAKKKELLASLKVSFDELLKHNVPAKDVSTEFEIPTKNGNASVQGYRINDFIYANKAKSTGMQIETIRD